MKRFPDKIFLTIVSILIVGGFLIFLSAALGLLARKGLEFSQIVGNQSLALLLGLLGLFLAMNVHPRTLKKYSFYFFFITILITVAVFLPGVGLYHGGAERWIVFGPVSFQPSELLKLGFVLYFAAWLSSYSRKVFSFTYGLLPFLILMGIVGFLLLKQPDTGTFLVIFVTGFAMFVASGGPWKHSFIAGGGALVGVGILAELRPYVKERFMTFLNPALDPQGAGYQIQQSLIAVGSGEIFGRGPGQSVQKFNFLPEPIGDSVFAVFAEEFGFVGAMVLIALFVAFAFRGFTIARRAPDQFSGLVVLGIVILIISQAFFNIGSMIGVLPLTGLPLPFVSHGGSALIATLLGIGIILNISRYNKSVL